MVVVVVGDGNHLIADAVSVPFVTFVSPFPGDSTISHLSNRARSLPKTTSDIYNISNPVHTSRIYQTFTAR